METPASAIKGQVATRRIHLRPAAWIEPAEAFPRLVGRDGLIWLDSGMERERDGRWSFLMYEPVTVLRGGAGRFEMVTGTRIVPAPGNPFDTLDALLGRWRVTGSENPRPPFTGGAAGFFGYGLLGWIEPSTRLVKTAMAPEGDAWIGLYDRVIAFDHHARRVTLIANLEERQEPRPALDELERALTANHARYLPPAQGRVEARSNFTRESFMAAVERVRDYIAAGDIYQANIAQRFTAPAMADPAALYLKLRAINPAPFAAYLDTGAAQILCSSPERFISLAGGRAQTRPIKGTRPRGRDEAEDAALARDLLQSEKDRAENVMIVDLLRNDLSRVCEPHSVTVSDLLAVERFPTVLHLVSTVEGTLRPGLTAVDLLRAVFPGGSVTGAPKIRAMEIIDEIEPDPRGAYCGAIGYIGFDGGMDTNIVIRTMIRTDGAYTFHAGGGITYLSDPQAEYDETMDKARALIEAVSR